MEIILGLSNFSRLHVPKFKRILKIQSNLLHGDICFPISTKFGGFKCKVTEIEGQKLFADHKEFCEVRKAASMI